MEATFDGIQFIVGLLGDYILFWLGGLIIWFVVSRVYHFIKKRRGNAGKHWDKYLSAKKVTEEEKMKDPLYKAQKVWNEQDERHKDSERQIARELITATGRYKNRKPMTKDEVLRKIRAQEFPFSKWMLLEYLDGSLMSGTLTRAQRIRRKIYYLKYR